MGIDTIIPTSINPDFNPKFRENFAAQSGQHSAMLAFVNASSDFQPPRLLFSRDRIGLRRPALGVPISGGEACRGPKCQRFIR
ncbi:hypothetical protein Pla52o_47940 [Novipirellula galeiformis]|uniref:Uncharacterized protein n=1 Tax=Novipirellula galeiformis TaxID=2528004 RepID=A0A5C6CA72_9BACT|nr:hypothetical protein Pla52o_47940 [Novipirellula galeiformis]